MPETSDWKQDIARLRDRLLEDKRKAEDLSAWLGQQVEREPGIWEHDFDGLEAELWRRFTFREAHQNFTCEDRSLPQKRLPAAIFRRCHKWYRKLTDRFGHTIIDKRKQFDLEEQVMFNRESIPFDLAVILTLQKVKDRLNKIEETLQKMEQEQNEISKDVLAATRPESRKPKG